MNKLIFAFITFIIFVSSLVIAADIQAPIIDYFTIPTNVYTGDGFTIAVQAHDNVAMNYLKIISNGTLGTVQLNCNGTQTCSNTWTTSENNPGVYRYRLLAADTSNNIRIWTKYVTVTQPPSLPDLTVSNIVFNPINPMQFQSLDISFDISNIDQVSASNIQFDVYDTTTNTLLTSGTISSLSPGQHFIPSIQDTIVTQTSGPHAIRVRVDFTNTIQESNENNNQLTASVTVSAPSLAPKWSNPTVIPSSPIAYAPGQGYIFGITWTDNIGLDYTLLEFNGFSIRRDLSGTIETVSITLNDLAAGTYTYRWRGFDTNGNQNITPDFTYAITKALPIITFNAFPSWTVDQGTETTVSCSANTNEYALLFLNRNGVPVPNPNTATLDPGTYDYTCTAPETQNYTSVFVADTLTINPVQMLPDLTVQIITFNPPNPFVNQPVNIRFDISNIGSAIANNIQYDVFDLTNNFMLGSGTIASLQSGQSQPIILTTSFPNAGTYTIRVRVDQSNLISESDETNNEAIASVTVFPVGDANPPTCSNFITNPSSPTTYAPDKNYQFNVTCTDQSQITNVTFFLASGLNVWIGNYPGSVQRDGDVFFIDISDLPASDYSYSWIADDEFGNRFTSPLITYTIEKAQTTLKLFLNGTEANRNYAVGDFANFTVLLENLPGKSVVISSDIPGFATQIGASPLEVVEQLNDRGTFVVSGSFVGDQNYSASYQTYQIVIDGMDVTPPIITILSPQNTTYNNNIIDLIFTIDEPTSWTGYSLDGQANVTSGNITLINLQSGTHNIAVYATDLAGNTGSADVYFTVSCLSHLTDSYVDGFYYLDEITNILGISTVTCSLIDTTNVTTSNIDISDITLSTIDNSTIINSNVYNCTISDSTLVDQTCRDSSIDPSDVQRSNTTGSTITDSHVWDSNATYSSITLSWLDFCDITNSTLFNITCKNSSIFLSNVSNSTITNSIIRNSTIENSNIRDMTVENATIKDNVLIEGCINYLGVDYCAPKNLNDIYNPPQQGDGGGGGAGIGFSPFLTIDSSAEVELELGVEESFSVNVRNEGPSYLPSVTLDVAGIPGQWFVVSPTSQLIDSKQSRSFTITINIPLTEIPGVRTVTLITKGDGVEARKTMRLNVKESITQPAGLGGLTGALIIISNPAVATGIIVIIIAVALIYLYYFRREKWNALVSFVKTIPTRIKTGFDRLIGKEVIEIEEYTKPSAKQTEIEVAEHPDAEDVAKFTVEYEE